MVITTRAGDPINPAKPGVLPLNYGGIYLQSRKQLLVCQTGTTLKLAFSFT